MWLELFLLWLVCTIIYFWYMCRYFWTFSRQGVPVNGTPLPVFGTMLEMMKVGAIESDKGHLEKFGKTYGAYAGRMPVLYTIDFDIIREVFIKDQDTFPNRNRFQSGDPLNDDMLNNVTDPEKWKFLRTVMSPTFSSGKLKRMMPQLNKSARQLVGHLAKDSKDDKSVELKEYAGSYTMDVIASVGFGIDLNSKEDDKNAFVTYAKKAFEFNVWNPLFMAIFFAPFLVVFLAKYVKLPVMKKDVAKFFVDVTDQVLEARKDDEDRVDLLGLMIKAHKEVEGERSMTRAELTSQAFMFFLAGYDTTASTIGFLAHSLGTNPEKQDKLFEEIDTVLGDQDEIKDEHIQNMPYLDMCVNETLRMFPPASFTERQAQHDTVIKGIKLPEYSFVRVPIHHMHHLPELYPEPEKFLPERFSTEEKAKRNPLSYFPFGAGPRNCIAMRLALLEVKVAIVHILKRFRITQGPETESPIKLSNTVGLLKPENGFWLRMEERSAPQ